MFQSIANSKHLVALVIILMLLLTGACAALQPLDTNGPTANLPPYPIALADPGRRLEEASTAWSQMSQQYGLATKTEAALNPNTGTLQNLPASAGTSITLPKVGTDAVPTEEQTRESLR